MMTGMGRRWGGGWRDHAEADSDDDNGDDSLVRENEGFCTTRFFKRERERENYCLVS